MIICLTDGGKMSMLSGVSTEVSEWSCSVIHCTLFSLYYAQKQLLLSARLSHRNSVCPSVRHTGGSVKNGAS